METPEEIKKFDAFAATVIKALPRFVGPKIDEYINKPEILKEILENALNGDMYFKETVNYNYPFNDIVLAGDYKNVEDGINAENYDTKRKGEVKDTVFRVVRIPEEMEAEQVLKYLESVSVRLASNYELIYFGYLHPELQEKMMIHSLTRSKKIKNDPRNCLCLSYFTAKEERALVKSYFRNCYRKNSAFLGVYEEPSINQKNKLK